MKVSSILVVEDSEPDQFLCKVMLERFNPDIQVMQAYDGQEALDFLTKAGEQPDLIFLDINMPGMDGYEFLDKYCGGKSKAVTADKKADVIMLTSSSFAGDKKRSLAYDCVKDYIMKPFTVDKIKDVVAHYNH